MIVQDREPVIEQLPDAIGLDKMVHDFFTPQPVHSARAYYFRRILHVWNDEHSLAILRNAALAMVLGYSKVLISGLVVPRRVVSLFATNQDLNMTPLLSTLERTDEQWQKLLAAAGLKIVKIWIPEGRI